MPDSDATSSDEGDMYAGAQQPPQHPKILGIWLIIHIFVQLGPGLKSKTKAEH